MNTNEKTTLKAVFKQRNIAEARVTKLRKALEAIPGLIEDSDYSGVLAVVRTALADLAEAEAKD